MAHKAKEMSIKRCLILVFTTSLDAKYMHMEEESWGISALVQ